MLGSVGYRFIEGPTWSFLDGLYMTVLTIFTVGYAEVHPLSDSGRLFTILLILAGVGDIAYIASSSAQFFFEGKLKEIWGVKRMQEKIKSLEEHYIICGAGKTAREIIKTLKKSAPQKFVVIDVDKDRIRQLQDEEVFSIVGDATLDDTLISAGLDNAKGLVAALPTDADNVFVTLTAKGINQETFVVSKAEKVESIAKLKRAGADKVVSPNIIAGARMVAMLRRPSVVDFMDAALGGDNQALQMDEFRIQKQSFLENKALKDADIRGKSGAIIVAVRRDNENTINPEPTFVFQACDILVVLGTKEQIKNFSNLTQQI